MKLFFAAAAIALILASGLAAARPLVDFSSGSVHMRVGANEIVKTYVSNPDLQFANITLWLGGDYPAALVKFSADNGLYLTADQRNLTVGLNPKEERMLILVILSTGPKDGGYRITLNANTTGSAKKDSIAAKIFIDYPPSFPGLETYGIALILALSGLAYWRIKK